LTLLPLLLTSAFGVAGPLCTRLSENSSKTYAKAGAATITAIVSIAANNIDPFNPLDVSSSHRATSS
jgi:hypothetical protein